MRAVIQRVSNARVDIEGQTVASIGGGLLVFIGIGKGDGNETVSRLAAKVSRLRIFSDPKGKMNLSVRDTGGQVLVVSQFTLYADCSRGNRPGFEQAGEASKARELVEWFIQSMKDQGVETFSGRFGADMSVSLVNDGPVTILLEDS